MGSHKSRPRSAWGFRCARSKTGKSPATCRADSASSRSSNWFPQGNH